MIDKDIQHELRMQYNPEGSTLRNRQLQLVDMLREFDTICQRHNISYWIDSGTLIGAVRHGGFIPWDDDVDICILKKDASKLRRVLQQELNYPVYYVDEVCDKSYTRKWGRLERLSVIEGEQQKVWIDVFFLIPTTRKCVQFVHSTYGKCYRRKNGLIKDGTMKRIVGTILYPLAAVMTWIITIGTSIFCRNTLMFDYGTGFLSVRKKSDIYPLQRIAFEGVMLNVPCDSDSYLKRIYGDYLQIPAVEQRVNHASPTTFQLN